MVRDLKLFTDALKNKEISTLNQTTIISSEKEKSKSKPSMLKDSHSTLSILQRNYVKMRPIIIELYNSLVREDGEPDDFKADLDLPNSDDENDRMVDLETIASDVMAKPSTNNTKLSEKVGTMSITAKKKPGRKLDMRNFLGFLNQNLYHDYLNITNIMKLKRLDFRDVYSIRSPDLMITRENLIERIMILITSYFCMGTELRFLKQLKLDGFESTLDAEYWHGKALEISVKFLPGDCPLVKHIVASYKKNHSPSTESIPEDSEVSSHVRIIKPLDGIEVQKVSPIIKKIDTPSVKLSPLDLAPNDYLSEFQCQKTDRKGDINEFKFQVENMKLSAREINSKADPDLLKSSAKKLSSKMKIESEEDSLSMDLDNFDFKISFDKSNSQELTNQLRSYHNSKQNTGELNITDYNTTNNRKVISNNFFEKIKPIVKSLKNNPKFANKKPDTKDETTSTDNVINIQSEMDEFKVVTALNQSQKITNLKTKATQTLGSFDKASK